MVSFTDISFVFYDPKITYTDTIYVVGTVTISYYTTVGGDIK